MTVTKERVTASCSFCLRPSNEVARLVAGPGVYVYNECVDLCRQIISSPPSLPPELTSWEENLDLDGVLANLPSDGGRRCAGRNQSLSLREEGERARRYMGGHRNILGDARQSAWERFSGDE